MKHFKLMALAIAFIMAFVNCSPVQADKVLTPESDYQLRPGMKPQTITVLDFNATWCGPCRVFAPIFHKASDKFPRIKFYSVDIDEYEETASAFGITAVPTIMIISPDGSTKTIVGLGEEITAGIEEWMSDEEAEETAYNNFCKLIMKIAANK